MARLGWRASFLSRSFNALYPASSRRLDCAGRAERELSTHLGSSFSTAYEACVLSIASPCRSHSAGHTAAKHTRTTAIHDDKFDATKAETTHPCSQPRPQPQTAPLCELLSRQRRELSTCQSQGSEMVSGVCVSSFFLFSFELRWIVSRWSAGRTGESRPRARREKTEREIGTLWPTHRRAPSSSTRPYERRRQLVAGRRVGRSLASSLASARSQPPAFALRRDAMG